MAKSLKISAPSHVALAAALCSLGCASAPAFSQAATSRVDAPINDTKVPAAPAAFAPAAQPEAADTASQSGTAEAPAVAEPGIADIVVTAEKRSGSLQRTPVAVTALSGADLANAQLRTLQDVQSVVPSLKVASNNGYAQITIRGIGITNFVPGAESAVAVNLNGVFVSRQIAQLTSLYDVSSLEVLRGPQGTLYGRNATAGSVNIATTPPGGTLTGYGRLTVGNYGLVRGEVAVGGPLINDKLAVRVAGFGERRNGYGRNLVTGNDIDDKRAYGARVTLLVTPTDRLKATLIAEYFHERDNNAGVHYLGAAGLTGLPGALGVPPLFQQLGGYAPSQKSFDLANGEDPRFRLRTLALTGTLDWSTGPFSFRSITGYRRQRSETFNAIDGGFPFNSFYLSGEPAHQLSQELQARYDSSRFHLTVGGYYFRETDRADPSVAALSSTAIGLGFGIPLPPAQYFVDFVEIGGTIRTRAKAAFAQGTFDVTDRLSLTAGVRYSHERKSFDQQFSFNLFEPFTGVLPSAVRQPPRTFTATDPKLGIQFQLTSRTLLYATYSKGFKSGSFDIGFAPSLGFKPERLTDYEGGLKTTVFDNRLRLNLAGFYYEYADLQVPQVVGFSVTTTNAATARLHGIEAEATFLPVPEFKLDASATYLHARYRRYAGPDAARPFLGSVDFSGNQLNNAPDFAAHVAGEYTWSLQRGSLSLRAEGDYTSRFFFTAANLPLQGQKAFAKANAFVTYDAGSSWSATAFVRNVTNRITRQSAVVQSPQLGNPTNGSLAPPRTFGAEFGYKF